MHMAERDDDEDEGQGNGDGLISPSEHVAEKPADVADPAEVVRKKIPPDIYEKYEVYSYRNAAVILTETRKGEFKDILVALRKFSLTTNMIRRPGGNESEIPKLFSAMLRPEGWHETVIEGDLQVRRLWKVPTGTTSKGKETYEKRRREAVRENFLAGHKIDYVKGRVAFDLEWNSKDQTFDRDLYAFSAFAVCGEIDAAVLVTRSVELNPVFHQLGFALDKHGTETKKLTSAKYGASTTWMGKLLYRLNAGRNGGCPVLALGIRPKCIADWKPKHERTPNTERANR